MFRALVEEDNTDISAFDMKQATMPDISCPGPALFEGVRPSLVTDEGEAQGTFAK